MRRGNKWVKLIWLTIAFYTLFTFGRLAYRNYQLNQEELGLKSEIAALQNEIQHLKNQIVYFQSDSYREKMIRAKLNLKKEGESVVVIPPDPETEEVEVEEEEMAEKTNPEKWLSYFFGR